jgi:precorrin-6B methylase 2
MNNLQPLSRRLLMLSFVVGTSALYAQTAHKPYEPQVGQPGKDVVWVPTSATLVEKMLDLAKVTQQDYVIDLGSGDGRTVIAAAKRGAHALGIEFNPDLVALSKRNAAKAGAGERVAFVREDFFQTDLSRATVITMFLLPDINLKLRPKLLDLRPGTRVVSNSFTMEEWQADETATVQGDCESWCTALLWIVPARVGGTWHLPAGRLTITQKFQIITGTLGTAPLSDGRLRGNDITFTTGKVRYTGRVRGSTIQGTTSDGGRWTATRQGS